MTQLPDYISVAQILESLDVINIEDEQLRKIIEILLNRIEQLESKVSKVEAENQKLQDENNRLKGEKGKPKIKPSRAKNKETNHSSEKERHKPQPHRKSSKNENINIDREEILVISLEQMPSDVQFKGYEEVLVQDIKLGTDNILFRKQKYYSPTKGKTYLAEMPVGYEGQFGPNLKALCVALYYGSNMTEGKLIEFLSDIGISISSGQLSNVLIKNHEDFHTEKGEILNAGLESSPWQHFDQTHCRVNGENYNCNVVCNPLYTTYHTTRKKDRLSVIDALIPGHKLHYLLNREALELLEIWNISSKTIQLLEKLPSEIEWEEDAFLELLSTQVPGLGKNHHSRILEATAIAAYHRQTKYPAITVLVCDDAPQFKLLTSDIALCWIHDGRHYKKLRPLVASHKKRLDKFLEEYWDYYHQLRDYRHNPTQESKEQLRVRFGDLFSTTTGYWELDDRIRRTFDKEVELLMVLEHPELPLHNNPAELGARTMVLRRNISYGTRTLEGTKAWDTFLSLVATTRKLGVSFFEYVRSRICQNCEIPSLSKIINEKAMILQLGLSWNSASLLSPIY
ncbi:MAG: transposase [Methylacidiphilales bacterium]|nr:transposase [Candidatus Methylacidiphilales bacterium]NJR76491.1 transposase [Scytonema sp. CRU_2_7]